MPFIQKLESLTYRVNGAGPFLPIADAFALDYLLARRVLYDSDQYTSGPPLARGIICIGRIYFRDPNTAELLIDLASYNAASADWLAATYRLDGVLRVKTFLNVIFGVSGGLVFQTPHFDADDGSVPIQTLPFIVGTDPSSDIANFIING